MEKKGLFQFTTSDYSLRGTNVLVLPQPKTTTYRYAAARIGTRFLILLGEPLVWKNLDVYFFPIVS